MDAAEEIGRNPTILMIQSECGRMSKLARDGTAQPVSRDQTLRRERR